MTTFYDIVVLGGGPAGSAAAMRAQSLGLSVALIDKAVFPREKLCGAMLSGRSMRALGDIFGHDFTVPDALVSRDVLFRWQGENLARFEAPHPLALTMRFDFDEALQRHSIAAGTKAFHGVRQIDIDPAGSTITVHWLVGIYSRFDLCSLEHGTHHPSDAGGELARHAKGGA